MPGSPAASELALGVLHHVPALPRVLFDQFLVLCAPRNNLEPTTYGSHFSARVSRDEMRQFTLYVLPQTAPATDDN